MKKLAIEEKQDTFSTYHSLLIAPTSKPGKRK